MDYIIIGNGVAGTEAAITIRKNDSEGRIKIISESPGLFYYRPKIIDLLENKTTVEKMTIYKDDFYKTRKIECLTGSKVISINPGENYVKLDSDQISYDKLLLATGANCFVPPINGAEKNGVFTLRSTEDAHAIKEYCKEIKTVLFIGGGLLGLETACSLLKENQKGIVVEFFPRLLPRQLDDQGGEFLKKKIEDTRDLRFILNDSVADIKGDNSVTGVILKSGEEIACQAVIISAGVRSRVELALEAGINVDRGILVNDYLETSEKNIYCAGDASNHNGRTYGLWMPSKEQGRHAGLNMSGIKTKYNGSVVSAKLKVSGMDMFSAGFTEDSGYIERSANNTDYYLKLFMNEGKPEGLIAIGKKNVVDHAEKCSLGRADYSELEKYL